MGEKKGFFSRLVKGLTKTRDNIVSGIDSIFNGFSAIDDDFYEELEEALIMGDIGIDTTMSIMETLRQKVKEQKIKDPAECKACLLYTSGRRPHRRGGAFQSGLCRRDERTGRKDKRDSGRRGKAGTVHRCH